MSILFHLFLYIITYNHRYLFDKTFYTKNKRELPENPPQTCSLFISYIYSSYSELLFVFSKKILH